MSAILGNTKETIELKLPKKVLTYLDQEEQDDDDNIDNNN